MKRSIVALALGTFALGIAEFSMMGILNDVTNDMNIEVDVAGHLISSYSLGVAIGSLLLIVLRNVPLRKLMLILAGTIFAGNLASCISPDFYVLLCSRFISGLPHGAFFGAGAIVCSRLADKGHGAEAVAVMVGGMTIANLVGVPFATLCSSLLSWRVAFATSATFGLAAVFCIRMWTPILTVAPDTGLRGQFSFLGRVEPWLIYAGVFFGQASVYCWLSYIAPIMREVSGFSSGGLTWIMVLVGGGMVFGNAVAGKLSDRFSASGVTCVLAALMIAVMPCIYFTAEVKWISAMLAFVASAGLFGIGGPLQYLIVRYAKGGEMLGGAGIQIAFNVSNAFSASLGGLCIHYGLGLSSPALIGAPLAAIATIALLRLNIRERRKEACEH